MQPRKLNWTVSMRWSRKCCSTTTYAWMPKLSKNGTAIWPWTVNSMCYFSLESLRKISPEPGPRTRSWRRILLGKFYAESQHFIANKMELLTSKGFFKLCTLSPYFGAKTSKQRNAMPTLVHSCANTFPKYSFTETRCWCKEWWKEKDSCPMPY